MSAVRSTAVLTAIAVVIGACGADRPEFRDAAPQPTTTGTVAPAAASAPPATPTTTPTTTQPEPPFVQPVAPNGRSYPAVPQDAAEAGARLYEVESSIHSLDPGSDAWADLAHEQQMLYRVIGRNPGWIADVVGAAPDQLATIIERHLAARRSIAGIGGEGDPPSNVPAWAIIEPLPADELRALYDEASADTGIGWSFLAAINLLETGFGRIDGLSTAGAQGPMQFLPTTFAEVSDGDIDDPHDAIPAAARYLVRRGGPEDMHNALWGYNNSVAYVAAVTHYANLFRDDERSFLAAHSWEIHYSAASGDLWLPVGLRLEEPQPVVDYLDDAPWSAPPPPPS